MTLYDVSNTFQTNVIDDPSKRHFLRLPPLYQQWFKQRCPIHLLHSSCDDWKQLVMQTLRNLQGTKDAGHEWYQLLSKIFHNLGMTPNTMCKGVFVWKNIDSQKHDHGYLILATDDILLATNSTKATMLLEKK